MPPVRWNLSREELDAHPWVVLRIKTSGLMGGANYNQTFDFSHACPKCGAGAQTSPVLVANLTKMGRKMVDRTAHEGQFVVSADLAAALRASDLTGFVLSPVRHFATLRADPRFYRLRIVAQWPQMHPRRILDVEDLCPRCQRAGHFDAYRRASEFWYGQAPLNPYDFNFTWEYFGVWRPGTASTYRNPVRG